MMEARELLRSHVKRLSIKLVMKKSQKDVILSLVAQNFRDKTSETGANEQVDIFPGKGAPSLSIVG
jgi:hypothetical protein